MNSCTRTSKGLILTQTILGLSETLLPYQKKQLSLRLPRESCSLLIEETLSDHHIHAMHLRDNFKNLVQSNLKVKRATRNCLLRQTVIRLNIVVESLKCLYFSLSFSGDMSACTENIS